MSESEQTSEVYFQPNADYWELKCRNRFGDLLLALTEVLPSGLTLYAEGIAMAPDVAAYLGARAAEALAVHRGTIWPRPAVHHMPMTPENMAGLVRLMETHAEPEVAEHLHAYKGTTAYVIWYDALSSSPLYVRNDVPEADIHRLCTEYRCTYRAFR